MLNKKGLPTRTDPTKHLPRQLSTFGSRSPALLLILDAANLVFLFETNPFKIIKLVNTGNFEQSYRKNSHILTNMAAMNQIYINHDHSDRTQRLASYIE